MKSIYKFIVALSAVILFLSACTQMSAPPAGIETLTYSIDATDKTFLVDLSYYDVDNNIVKLTDQSLPWSLTLDLSTNFIGDVYFKADIPQSEVFIPFVSGIADSDVIKTLVDSSADFLTSGVVKGDIVYSDNTSLESASVISVLDQHTIALSTDLLPLGNEPYYIYHVKNLTASVDYNGTIVAEKFNESERILSALVKTSIDR